MIIDKQIVLKNPKKGKRNPKKRLKNSKKGKKIPKKGKKPEKTRKNPVKAGFFQVGFFGFFRVGFFGLGFLIPTLLHIQYTYNYIYNVSTYKGMQYTYKYKIPSFHCFRRASRASFYLSSTPSWSTMKSYS